MRLVASAPRKERQALPLVLSVSPGRRPRISAAIYGPNLLAQDVVEDQEGDRLGIRDVDDEEGKLIMRAFLDARDHLDFARKIIGSAEV